MGIHVHAKFCFIIVWQEICINLRLIKLYSYMAVVDDKKVTIIVLVICISV